MKKVVIYSTPTCSHCLLAKEYLTRCGVTYQEKDVSVDSSARQEMIDKSQQLSVPVIIIDDQEIVIGFNQEQLDHHLGL